MDTDEHGSFLTAKYAKYTKGRWEGRKEENLTTDFTDFDGWNRYGAERQNHGRAES
jgi:hypothetical protein